MNFSRMSPVLRTITSMSESVIDPATSLDPTTIELRPDASILDALGRGHTLASALADLIDNSIDAGASRIGIRFVTKRSVVRSVRISDDGCGMTAMQLESAMSLGRNREYEEKSLGHFGVGLKGASFSQAKMLTVYSATGYAPTAAMRLGREQTGPGIVADVFDSETATALLRRRGFIEGSGTLVEWTHLEAVSVASAVQERRRWVESMILHVRDELGLTFHRLLADGRIRISLEEMDEESGDTGAPRAVKAIDPFAFERWGAVGYPRALTGQLASGAAIEGKCFILPPGVVSSASQPLGRRRSEAQGLFVYRNDRLLQAGGWLGLRTDSPADLQLARIALDIGDNALDAVAINPEKRGVVLRPAAVQALESAVIDGFTLRSFWDDARGALAESRQRELKAQPVAVPGKGAPAGLRAVFDRTVGVRGEADAGVSFDWADMPNGQLFAFEPVTGTVFLNSRHREQLERDATQFEVLKTSLFFSLQEHAGKERIGPTTVETVNAMQAAFAASMGIQQWAEPPPAVEEVEDSDVVVSVIDEPIIEIHDAVISRSDPDEPLGDPHVAHIHVQSAMDDYGRLAKMTPLLIAAEEVELAIQIEAGVLAEAKLQAKPSGIHSREERRDYVALVAQGARAVERMINANLRLVISIARSYQGNGLDLIDLVQEGNLGLMHAVQKFDYVQGNKFSTYASWWIRQGVTRALADKGRLIRLPVHVIEKLPKVRAALEETVGTHTQRVEIVAEMLEERVKAVRAIVLADEPILSLDAFQTVELADGTWTQVPLSEVLQDGDAVSAEELINFDMLQRQIEQLLDGLTVREAGVIRMRFGIGDGEVRTLDEIGGAFGLTRERIRQIVVQTMKKLSHPSRTQSLRDYLIDDLPPAGTRGLASAPLREGVIQATNHDARAVEVFGHTVLLSAHPRYGLPSDAQRAGACDRRSGD